MLYVIYYILYIYTILSFGKILEAELNLIIFSSKGIYECVSIMNKTRNIRSAWRFCIKHFSGLLYFPG